MEEKEVEVCVACDEWGPAVAEQPVDLTGECGVEGGKGRATRAFYWLNGVGHAGERESKGKG